MPRAPAELAREIVTISCPDTAQRHRAEARRVTRRPLARPLPDGRRGLTKDDTRTWINALEESEQRKNAALTQVIAEADACRRRATPASPTT